MRHTWVRNTATLLCGLLGTLLAIGLWHGYSDHNILHELIRIEVARSQQQQSTQIKPQ